MNGLLGLIVVGIVIVLVGAWVRIIISTIQALRGKTEEPADQNEYSFAEDQARMMSAFTGPIQSSGSYDHYGDGEIE